MMNPRQLLRAPAACRIALLPPARPQARAYALFAPSLSHTRFMSLPRILQPSFWISMVPKPFRGRSEHSGPREWNPATPYIVLGLLVGSQAIQILWLKQENAHSVRKAEAKIGLLREVIGRIQNGEDVPVESLLGTGNAESEKEWAEGEFMSTKGLAPTSDCSSLLTCLSLEGYPRRGGPLPEQEEKKGSQASCCGKALRGNDNR